MSQDFEDLVDLAGERVGGSVVACNDEFFAEKENLLRPGAAQWDEHRYTDRGKWMDGWETRRRREPGHDWCIVRLGLPGIVRGVVVDTAYFRGNFPEACSLDAACVAGYPSPAELESEEWTEILPRALLEGNCKNRFSIDAAWRATHLRLRIYPDGGVARLRVHGNVEPDWRALLRRPELDLAASENGASVPVCSDMFFGSRHNLIAPGPARTMGEGWETKRRRGAGHDWIVVKLAEHGTVGLAEIDTTHFKGNAPGSAALELADAIDGPWTELLPPRALLPHTRHRFDAELVPGVSGSYARLRVFPDGGVARLRLLGAFSSAARARLAARRVDALPPRVAEQEFLAVCASMTWASAMVAARPFESLDAARAVAERAWARCEEPDWREAFAAHPRIGERRADADAQSRAWSEAEQAAVAAGASEDDAAARAVLPSANQAYEARFGHVFLICAAGRGAAEILRELRRRMLNAPAEELRTAAAEQAKITLSRLERLYGSAP
jgi:allantoicase